MIDYKLLNALAKIYELGSFEKAAKILNITQPAITLRIKLLQDQYNDQLIIKTNPYSLTDLGQKLITHFREVNSLEEKFLHDQKSKYYIKKISIALSRDLMELWFKNFILKLPNNYNFEIVVDDQDHTLDYLRKGKASMCISSNKYNISNCRMLSMGNFDYVLVCARELYEKNFKNKTIKNGLLNTPTILFDCKDKILFDFLKENFDIDEYMIADKINIVPSVNSFKELVINNFAYGLIPLTDVYQEILSGELIQICNKKLKIPMHLIYFNFMDDYYKKLSQLILADFRKLIINSAI